MKHIKSFKLNESNQPKIYFLSLAYSKQDNGSFCILEMSEKLVSKIKNTMKIVKQNDIIGASIECDPWFLHSQEMPMETINHLNHLIDSMGNKYEQHCFVYERDLLHDNIKELDDFISLNQTTYCEIDSYGGYCFFNEMDYDFMNTDYPKVEKLDLKEIRIKLEANKMGLL